MEGNKGPRFSEWEAGPAQCPPHQPSFSPSSQAIKRTFDKKTVDMYMLFNRELALVNKELSKRAAFLPPHMCHFSGLAHWMRGLRRRIDRPMKVRAPAPRTTVVACDR